MDIEKEKTLRLMVTETFSKQVKFTSALGTEMVRAAIICGAGQFCKPENKRPGLQVDGR